MTRLFLHFWNASATFKISQKEPVSQIRDVEAVISSTASASTPIASASTNKKRENDRWP